MWIELDFTNEPEATPGQLVNESLDVAVKFARASGTKRKMVKTILSDDYSFGQPASRRPRQEVAQNMWNYFVKLVGIEEKIHWTEKRLRIEENIWSLEQAIWIFL